MIRLAVESDLDLIIAIVERAKMEMISRNIFQWNEFYPLKADYLKDILERNLFVLTENETILAAVCVNQIQSKEYQLVSWKYPSERVAVIHRLVVDPLSQGKRIGQQLLDFSENLARIEFNSDCMRLDAFTQNPKALHLYEKNNYYRCGEIYFPYRVEPFFAFEKILK